MTESISSSLPDPVRIKKQYCVRRMLGFVLALLIGLGLAYAESRAWLPCLLTDIFSVKTISPALIGPCIAQTSVIPLVMIAGLFRTSYYYTSRVWLSAFGLLHGIELLPCIVNAPIALILLIPALVCMALIFFQADTLAAGGIRSCSCPRGYKPMDYIYRALRLWGGMLIVQFIYYLIYIWLECS